MKTLLLILSLFIGIQVFANPPKPPLGMRWVLNPDFSDEFDGNSLDTSKWLDHHPTWMGREPGLFMPSQVSVKNGYLQIRGEKMDKDTLIKAYNREMTFNIKGGAVVSKKSVFLGYYECRVKAAATTMSTTFWFSGKGGVGPKGCDQYSQEWDIQECIGREGDFNGKYFAKGMHSNAHYWYNDCNGERHDYRAPQVRFEDEELASANFHVYGGWWRDESSASYYYDNREPKHQKFYSEIDPKPFKKPMYMRLVCETYPFPWIELPNDEELADTSKNTVYYDWVRGYRLVDASQYVGFSEKELVKIYDESVLFDEAVQEIDAKAPLSVPIAYQCNEDRMITLTLFDSEGKKLHSEKMKAFSGYSYQMMPLNYTGRLDGKSIYKLTAQMTPMDESDSEKLDTNTLYIHTK